MVQIETAHNVVLSHQAASIATRFLAALIDYVIALAYLFAASFLIMEILRMIDFSSVLWTIVVLLPLIFYNLFCEMFFEGQSLGKKLMRIKVVRMDGSPVRMGDYLLRWAFRLFELIMTLGGVAIITVILNGKGQRLGDIAAGTLVISLQKRIYLKEILFLGKNAAHQLHYPQVARFQDKDINLIREVATDAMRINNSKIVEKLAEKVAQQLEVELPPVPPLRFLEQVVKDYHYVHMDV